uniref:RNA binding motif protein 27 n=1 Tax=Neogobius melanostomus TaxID=47308 RepID=A0A8C6T9E4_9GOBI
MIIEQVDVLKTWLAKLLEPICEADPAALANYVVALVKKDKPEKDLKALCADQLEVFLQKETMGFVDKLFECLTTKNYLGNPPSREPSKEEVKQPIVKTDIVEERRRDDRKRRDFDRHGKSGSDSHRDRERHERRRGSPRGRSYSRSRSRSRSGSRGKNQEHRGGRGERERERAPLAPAAHPSAPSAPTAPTASTTTTPLTPTTPILVVRWSDGASGVPVSTLAHMPDSTTDSWSTFFNQRPDAGKPFINKNPSLKPRCRDYDVKGFCVRGDLCPFDHGNDPLVVDDVNLPNMLPFPPTPILPPPRAPPGLVSPPGPPLIATSGIDPPNHQSAVTSSPPIGPPGVGLPPPNLPPPSSSSVSLHPPYVQSEYNYDAEGYNPEAPGLTGSGRNAPFRHFIPRVQTQRHNLIGLTSNEGQGSRAANIVIQTEPPSGNSNPGLNRFNSEQDSRKRSIETGSTVGPQIKKPWMDKPGFNNQHKGPFPKRNHYINTKLEVRKIPFDLNNITKLNEHFSKFGTIVNIQVGFGGDMDAALIQFTKNEEARRAISCAEAVLNNRFIRVYWHREPGANNTAAPSQDQGTGVQPAGPGIKQHNAAAYVLNKTVHKPRVQSTAGTSGTNTGDITSPETIIVPSALTNSQKGPFTPTSLKSSKSLGKTAKALIAQEALKQKQEALKLQQDMRKKKQEMLKTQIECQKALINRLEKNRGMKPEERVTGAKANHNQPKTKTDAQKELLDAELDFHKKMNSGEDTTDLKRKLGQLQVEVRGRGRGKMAVEHGAVGRGRGRSRDATGRGGTINRMVVDHRPRALAILGVTQEEKEELMPHFVKFGEIEDLRDHDATTVVMTFKTRSEAENAANQGAKFKGRVLQITWYKPKTPSVATEPEEEEAKEEDSSESGSYLAEEEEEEDDDEDDEYESRSWRR